ncbi:MAG: histidine--tRNA ligase [Puniceicoccaceae bacterium]|nr:MAG: histidine--tRNA ligase [Puniceicoccaceae bacterium]
MEPVRLLPGFRDFYPEAFRLRRHFATIWRQVAGLHGFSEYDGPVLEALDLFRKKSGEEIERQLFAFTDKGDRAVALRPEMTPTLARMVAAKAASLRRPVKWFSIGDQFRYERQQKGRLRCFTQFNADLLGEEGPAAEVELISLLAASLRAFGLTEEDFCIRISDRTFWIHFLETRGITGETARGVLGVVDKLERESPEATRQALGAVVGEAAADPLLEAIRRLVAVRDLGELEAIAGNGVDAGALGAARERLALWAELMADLEAIGLGDFVQVDLGVVRGLAYYTGFVFEAFDRKGAFRALAGGGRYDGLVELFGGPSLPAAGFAVGDVVLEELLRERGKLPPLVEAVDVYLVVGENSRRPALEAAAALRAHGYRVEYALKAGGFGKQFKAAAQSGARLALTFGPDEIARGVCKVKDLAARTEEEVPLASVLTAVARHFQA